MAGIRMLAGLAFAFAFFGGGLGAQETSRQSKSYLYACLDPAGKQTGSLELPALPAINGAAKASPGDALIGDNSLFQILPCLVDVAITGSEARFILVRPEGGQRAAMKLRVEGIVDAQDFRGNPEKVYRVSMKLADPLGRLFWPYTYNYFYRVRDLCFFAYDGPDENRATSRIVLVGSRDTGY